jgi:hypothetical protein
MNVLPTHRPGIAPIEAHFGGLPGQPKRAFAEYAGSAGFHQAEIFSDINAALNSGEPIVARSEHPAELLYSGLGESHFYFPEGRPRQRNDFVDRLRQLAETLNDPDRTYYSLCEGGLLGRMGYIEAERWRAEAAGVAGISSTQEDRNAFADQHSLSYWAVAPGDNMFMVGDSGRPGRYFVGNMTGDKDLVIIDGEEIAERLWLPEEESNIRDGAKLVDFYRRIRTLPILDKDNIPLVELTDPGDDKEPIPLQVLPTTQQQAPDFEVSHPSDSVYFLRGATGEGGVEFLFQTGRTVDYRTNPLQGGLGAQIFGDEAVAEYYLPETTMFLGYCGARDNAEDARRRFFMATIDHGSRSQAFKPQVTVGLEPDAAARLTDCSTGGRNGKKECFVQSDGVRALVQYYDTEARKIVTL